MDPSSTAQLAGPEIDPYRGGRGGPASGRPSMGQILTIWPLRSPNLASERGEQDLTLNTMLPAAINRDSTLWVLVAGLPTIGLKSNRWLGGVFGRFWGQNGQPPGFEFFLCAEGAHTFRPPGRDPSGRRPPKPYMVKAVVAHTKSCCSHFFFDHSNVCIKVHCLCES